jgi:superfamily II DNA/RNA helicase
MGAEGTEDPHRPRLRRRRQRRLPRPHRLRRHPHQFLTRSPSAAPTSRRGFPNQREEIDLLIATDCISEGQNLQDCDLLVNYDIHWNPVRIIQRFGRIDRIGSRNDSVQLVNFWPGADLDRYLGVKHRVEARMALVDLAATQTDNLLDTTQLEDLIKEDLLFRDRQLKRLKDEVLDLEDLDDSVSLTDFSLDEFRQDLLNFLQAHKHELERAPLGLYASSPRSPTFPWRSPASSTVSARKPHGHPR